MVYKCIENEKLFSFFFFFNFYGKSINNWYEEEESEFLVSKLVRIVVSNVDAIRPSSDAVLFMYRT